MWGMYSFPETFSVGAILSFNRAGWSLSIVAFGDRKDFLQFLRMVHFCGNAPCAKTAKERQAEALPAQDYCPHGFGSTSTYCPQEGVYRSRMFMTIKRLLIIIGVLFVILVGVSIYTFAILLGQTQANQASATPQTSLTSATLTPAVTVTTTKTARGRKFVGTIQSLGNQTFVITLSRGNKSVTVNVDASTTFATSNGAANFNDLKVGQMVQVKGHVDPLNSSTVLAVSILVM